MHDLARMHASHLPPECDFRVRVQVQIIGGETREIPADTECHELALDLNGRRMAKFVLWVQSEQDCYHRQSGVWQEAGFVGLWSGFVLTGVSPASCAKRPDVAV